MIEKQSLQSLTNDCPLSCPFFNCPLRSLLFLFVSTKERTSTHCFQQQNLYYPELEQACQRQLLTPSEFLGTHEITD